MWGWGEGERMGCGDGMRGRVNGVRVRISDCMCE